MIIGYANSMFTATHGILARGGTPPAALLLDTYTGASAAYSLRLLRTAYTGNCIRVRRSSDNAEQDFGFVANVLDTASLLTFCGVGNGFVTTWYDQSGNANNGTQATAANQPQIVVSGVVNNIGGKPMMTTFNKQLTNTQTNTATQATFSAFQNETSGNDAAYILPMMTVLSSIYAGVCQSGSGASPSENFGTPSYYGNGTLLTSTRAALSTAFRTGNKSLSSIIGGGTTTSGRNLQYAVGTFSGNFKTFEVVIYNSDQSANRTGIESDINTFYTIY